MIKIKDLLSPEKYQKAIQKRIAIIEERLIVLKDRQYDMPGDILEFNEWMKELRELYEKKRSI